MTLADVVARLSGAKSSGPNDQFVARCPVHNDRTASLSVGIGTDGRVLLHCHAGCSTDSILSALGLAVGDLFPDQAGVPVQTPVRPVIRAVSSPTYYDYSDSTGTVVHQVVRGADKSFRQRHRNGTGAWVWKSSGIRVPYRLSDLMATKDTTVWVCEGEKDVDACWDLGLSATTNLGGSGKWTQAETDALVQAGMTTAYVIPDNDIPGRTHAESVIASLTQAKMTATLVTLDGLKQHGDLSDWLTADSRHDRAALERCAQHAGALALQSPEATPPLSGRLESHPAPPDLLTAPSEFVRVSEGRYSLTYPALGIVFDASHLRRERHLDLHGQLTVRTTLQGAKTVDGVLSSSNLNFSSQQSRSRMANFLTLRSGAPELDWLGAVEALCWKVTGAEEEGTPVQALSDVALPVPEPTWEIAGIHLVPHEPCIMFGDGGTGKSYLALWIATQLCNRGEKVLYCDFEFSASEHRLRLQRLCGPDPLPGAQLQYVRCVNPLVTEQSRLEAAIHDHQITFAIYDSIVFGLNGPPESAEIAAAYFRATRSLGVGSLHLAHTTKQSSQDGQQADKPFGSAYFHNGARATYLVQRAPAGPNQALVELSITNKKSNVGPLLPPVGLRMTFTENRTEIDPFDVAESPDLSGSLPIWQRVKSLVATGPGMTVKELAEELSVPPGSVAKAVSRMDLFSRDSESRVHLASSRNEIIL
jgi:hypothetical protein